MVTFYYIMAFKTNTDVMQAESLLKHSRITATIIPTPREISKGCGLALRLSNSSKSDIITFCRSFPVAGSLYQMETSSVAGKHPTTLILTFPN